MHHKVPEIRFRRYPFLYLLLPLGLGIWVRDFLPAALEGVSFWMPVISCCMSLLLYFFRKQIRIQGLQLFLVLFCLFFVGILSAYLNGNDIALLKDKTRFKEAIGFVGIIDGAPQVKPKTIKIKVRLEAIHLPDHWKTSQETVLLYLYRKDSYEDLASGQRIIFPNKLEPVMNRGNPFEFDYARYLGRQGIFYQAFLSPQDIYVFGKQQKEPSAVERLHTRLLGSIERNIRDTATAALTEATLLNDRELLDNGIRKAYSATGIAHIIAISGMHVSLFFSIILGLLIWIKSPRLRWFKYLLGLPIIWLYIALTGFPPSAVRAATMFSFVFIALALRKQVQSLNFLFATGFILLCFRPSWLFDTGVQLSFSAVASILLFYQPINRLFQPKWKLLKWIWDGLSVSLAAQIIVFPFILYYFHQFPIWFLAANIPASLYSLLLMTMTLFLFLLDGIGIPCLWLGRLMESLTTNFHRIIFFLSEHTPDTFLHLYITIGQFWMLMGAVTLLCVFAFFKKGFFILSGVSVLCLLIGWFMLLDFKSEQQERIIVYNISKGSSIDYFNGRNASLMNGDTNTAIIDDQLQYTLLPARLGFHIINPLTRTSTAPVKIIDGKRILFLNKRILPKEGQHFPVDYLILNKATAPKAALVKVIFNPKKVILDGSFSRWQAVRLKKTFLQIGIPIHYVGSDGAWVFPEEK